ncbi:MAG TPA: NADPH-dependent 2,4-dienoyl-CoA reductase, partial [Aestuariivirgaceae bacterium]|nr:NADPH-dependent 2,4-dienoyl-CoA reductase [Aestuariivirgaceae bacterium]
LQLRRAGVRFLADVAYRRIDDDGLHMTVGGEAQTLDVDSIVVCAGQEPLRDLAGPLAAAGRSVHLIGGADVAAELDAQRAIDQAVALAARL